ncbi:MAG TPA: hypothetical protein VHE78_09215 [Gemmatimonadaceae bacterium]|nr:hypothetical protein [Gemmatimonadaceae bacterium]
MLRTTIGTVTLLATIGMSLGANAFGKEVAPVTRSGGGIATTKADA